jgi:hypothetical protein
MKKNTAQVECATAEVPELFYQVPFKDLISHQHLGLNINSWD